MKTFTEVSAWGDAHHPKIFDIIRIGLGISLVVKGWIFLTNAGLLKYIIIDNQAIQQPEWIITLIIIYVTYVHLVGGAAIALGLFTRLAAALQLPIIFGAVFLVNVLSSFVNSELWLSVLTLLLLIMFVLIGSGPWSIDRVISDMREENK